MPTEHAQPRNDATAASEQFLKDAGQEHLLQLAAEWPQDVRTEFLRHVAEIDWEELKSGQEEKVPTHIEPSRVITLKERSRRSAELSAPGRRAYEAGEVAVLIVAGGQGTRLGFPGPKGCFPIGPISRKPVYQYHAERFAALLERTGKPLQLLVMTSPATDAETREFFAKHHNFSLPEGTLRFFQQGTVPSLDENGRALLAERGALLENPDGHGGCFTALVRQGILADLRERGVKHLIYLQVDNILAPMYDPELIGLALTEKADVITKVVEKTEPSEKVGLLVHADGSDYLLEYIHLSAEDAAARDDDGGLRLRWGNTAMHYWSIDFLWRKAEQGFNLPVHRSKKPLKAWTDSGIEEVQGYKHERFIFDLLPEAMISIGLEVDRNQEFAPLKNAEGPDSPRTVHQLTRNLYADWLESIGVKVHPQARLEISPRYAPNRETLKFRWDQKVTEVNEDLLLEG